MEQALALASSAALHALILLLLVLASPLGIGESHGAMALVPVAVEVEDTSPLAKPANLPQGAVTQDKLETQLETLAKLSQPDADHPPSQPQSAETKMSSTDDAAPGSAAALRDFIRDQVERHWSLDLASLGAEEFSIPIRVEITSDGTVLKAEIINSARDMNPIYREVAASARNAVLSASPLSLPAGEYQNEMELILHLDPREALR